MGFTKDLRDRLVALQRTIEYDGSTLDAASFIPLMIQPHQLPLFVNIPSTTVRTQVGDTFYTLQRDWRMKLWFAKVGERLVSQNEDAAYDLQDVVFDFFVNKQRLQLNGQYLTNLVLFELTGAEGPIIDQYPSGGNETLSYYTISFNATVTYRSFCVG